MIKSLINSALWLPLVFWDTLRVTCEPRATFRYTYKPSSEHVRSADQSTRNAIRLASYHAKRYING